MTDFRIRIIVDPTGAVRGTQQVDRSLKRVGQTADRTRALIGRLFAFGAVTVGIRQLTQLSDTFTNIGNRLRTVTRDTAELTVVTEELFKVANRTRASFRGTAELFARVGLASRELGISQRELVQFTESVNKAIILSGASAREANAGLIQLSQGLASGTLRGDELRSVLEQLPVIADVIAKSMKITRGELRELGTEGKINADIVLKAFREARVELAERFARTIPTIGQSLQVLQNNFVQLVGRFNEGSGAANSLSRFILLLADNMDTVARAIAAVGIALGIFLAKWVAVTAATAGIAILANPFLALVAAIAVAGGALVAFGDEIVIIEGSLTNLQDVAQAAFEAMEKQVTIFVKFFTDNFGSVADLAAATFGDVELSIEGVLRVTARVVDTLVGLWQGAFDAILIIFSNYPAALESIFVRAFNLSLRSLTFFANKFIDVINILRETVGEDLLEPLEAFQIAGSEKARDIGVSMDKALADGIEGQHAARDALEDILTRAGVIARERLTQESKRRAVIEAARRGLSRTGERRVTVDRGFQSLLELTKKQGDLLKFSNQEREIQDGLLRAEKKLKRDLTDQQRELLGAQLRANQALADERALLDDIRGPTQDYERSLAALSRLLDEGTVSTDEFTKKQRDLRLTMLETVDTLEAGMERGLLRIGEQFTDVGSLIEDSMVGAFRGAEDALVDFVTTGKSSFKDFADSILKDIARIVVRQQIVGPIAGAFGSIFGGSLPGLDHGGSVRIGGNGGIDRNLLSVNGQPVARVSRGEDVSVGRGGGGGVTVQVIDRRTGTTGEAGEGVDVGQSTGPDGRQVIQVMIRDTVKAGLSGGQFDRPMSQRFGLKPVTRGR